MAVPSSHARPSSTPPRAPMDMRIESSAGKCVKISSANKRDDDASGTNKRIPNDRMRMERTTSLISASMCENDT